MIDASSRITMGTGSYGNPRVFWWGEDAKVTIGKYCSIADDVKIFLGGEHRTDWITTYPFSVLMPDFRHVPGHPKTKGDVVIENDVWIGYDAVILSGTYISSGAVIGARSVVSGFVPPYEIWAGNPAKCVKNRFSRYVISLLLDIKWWDWGGEKLKEFMPMLLSGDVDYIIEYHKKYFKMGMQDITFEQVKSAVICMKIEDQRKRLKERFKGRVVDIPSADSDLIAENDEYTNE